VDPDRSGRIPESCARMSGEHLSSDRRIMATPGRWLFRLARLGWVARGGTKEARPTDMGTTTKRRDVKGHDLVWVRRLSLVGIGVVVALTAYLFARYPAAPSNGLALTFTLIGAVALAVYAFFALRDTRQVDAETARITRYGVGGGLLVFLVVVAKTFGGMLLDWGAPLPSFLFANEAPFLTTTGLISVACGLLVSWRVNKVAAGAFMGAWAALVAGIGAAVVLLGAAALLAPNAAQGSGLGAQITLFSSPLLLSDTESSRVAAAVLQVGGLLVLLPIFTIIGGTLGEVIGVILARIGTLVRNGTRRARASTRLMRARSQVRRGHLNAAATELGIVLEDWLRTAVRARSERGVRRQQPFSLEQALIDLREARAVTRGDMDEIQLAIQVRDEVVNRGSTPARDEVARMLAVVQRLTRQKVGYVG
jgi:hypothetical protein